MAVEVKVGELISGVFVIVVPGVGVKVKVGSRVSEGEGMAVSVFGTGWKGVRVSCSAVRSGWKGVKVTGALKSVGVNGYGGWVILGKYKLKVESPGESMQPDSKQPTENTINKSFDLKSALIGNIIHHT